MKLRPQLPGLVLSLSLVGCVGLHYWAKGSASFDGGELGSGTWAFTWCSSGVHQRFFGADLGSARGTMRVLRTERNEPVIILSLPVAENKAIELTRANCTQLDVQVNGGDPFYDRTRGDTSGTAAFSCTTKTGGRVQGNVSFNCN